MRAMMSKLRLTVNETKTRGAACPKRRSTSWATRSGCVTLEGRASVHRDASRRRRRCRRIKAEIHELTAPVAVDEPVEDVVSELNRMLRGLVELLLLGTGQPGLPSHRQPRLRPAPRSFLDGSTRCESGEPARFPRREASTNSASCGCDCVLERTSVGVGVILVREPDAGNPPVRFDERGWETEHGPIWSDYRAHPRLYPPSSPRHHPNSAIALAPIAVVDCRDRSTETSWHDIGYPPDTDCQYDWCHQDGHARLWLIALLLEPWPDVH